MKSNLDSVSLRFGFFHGPLSLLLAVLIGFAGYTEENHATPPAEKLSVTCRIGYDGMIPEQSVMIPVVVQVRNRYRDLEGEIRITQPSSGKAEVTLVRRIRCANPSSLQFKLYPRVDFADEGGDYRVRVEVLFKDQALRPYVFQSEMMTQKLLIASMGIPPRFWSHADSPAKKEKDNGKGASHPTVVNFSLHHNVLEYSMAGFPNDPLDLAGFHAVFLSDFALSKLTPAQRLALETWVRQGGRLFVLWRGNQVPAGEFSAFFAGQRVEHTALYPLDFGMVMVQVMKSVNDEIPFWRYGKWEQTARAFLPYLVINPKSPVDSSRYMPGSRGIFHKLMNAESSTPLRWRGFFLLLLFSLGYIVCLGPLCWFVARKTGRLWIGQLFFFGAVGAATYIAWQYRELVIVRREQALFWGCVDVPQDMSWQHLRGYGYVYSTHNGVFRLSPAGKDLKIHCEESAGLERSHLAWVRQEDSGDVEARIPVFSSKIMFLENLDIKLTPLAEKQKDQGSKSWELAPEMARFYCFGCYLDLDTMQAYRLERSGQKLMVESVAVEWETMVMNFKKTAAEAVDPLLVSKRRLREIMWQYSLYVSRPFTKRSELLDVSLQQWPSSWEYQMMVTPLRGYERGILFLFFDIPTEKLGLSITPRLPSKTMLCYRILVARQKSE